MNTEFRLGVTASEYMDAVKKIGGYNVMQTPMWADVKVDWTHTFCILERDGKPVACAMLLIRKMAPGVKLVYAPRGYVLDYSDADAFNEFSDNVIAYAKRIGAYMVRIDPEIVLSRNHRKTVIVDPDGRAKLSTLTDAGYIHSGFAKDFHSYTQPRYNAEIAIADEDGNPLSDDVLLTSFDKKLRKFIGSYTANRGIFFEADTSFAAIAEFSRISEHTEQRQHILLRNEEYFARMKKAFGEDCVVFFAKMDLDEFISFCDEQIASADMDTAAQAKKDREDAVALKEKNGDVIILSALLTVAGQDKAYLMYSGFDDSAFARFRTTNQLRYEAMRYFRNRGCKIFSLMGIHGELSDSLSEFKLKFNPTVVEYAGEFEYPVKRFRYMVFKKLLPAAKRVYIKIKLKKVE